MMKKALYQIRLVEMLVVMRQADPRFIKSLETKLLSHTKFEFLVDIFQVVEAAKQCDLFSQEFYSGMFEHSV
jgi:hypothetical protein